MADPTLKTTRVLISYTASDGYRSEMSLSSARATTPQAVYIEAVEELSRLCALFGFEAEARQAFEGAAARVAQHREGKAR